jgi:hypothetical protein
VAAIFIEGSGERNLGQAALSSCGTTSMTEMLNPARIAALRAAETIGRPLGTSAFLGRLAALTGRDPRPGKRGRKSRAAQAVVGGARAEFPALGKKFPAH